MWVQVRGGASSPGIARRGDGRPVEDSLPPGHKSDQQQPADRDGDAEMGDDMGIPLATEDVMDSSDKRGRDEAEGQAEEPETCRIRLDDSNERMEDAMVVMKEPSSYRDALHELNLVKYDVCEIFSKPGS